MKEEFKKYINKNHSFDKKTLLGIFCLIIVIAGMFGFFYEFIFYFFNGGMKRFYWRGGNFLPWINIYATGSILIYILTYKYRKNPFLVFLIGTVSCGLLEYFSGLGIYLFNNGCRYWNYNLEILNFGNIGGFVCLRSILFFGLSGLFLIYVIVPFCFYIAKNINHDFFITASIILCSVFLFDEIYNLVIARVFSLPRAYNVYTRLGLSYVHFNLINHL